MVVYTRLGGVDIEETLAHIDKTGIIPGYNEWLDSKLVNKAYRATGAILQKPQWHMTMLNHDKRENLNMNDEKWKYLSDRWKSMGLFILLEVSLSES